MTVTLKDVQQPRTLLNLLDACKGPVSCYGVDLRNNRNVGNMICGMTAPGKGIPQLELTLATSEDLSQVLRYMREDNGRRISIDYSSAAARY